MFFSRSNTEEILEFKIASIRARLDSVVYLYKEPAFAEHAGLSWCAMSQRGIADQCDLAKL